MPIITLVSASAGELLPPPFMNAAELDGIKGYVLSMGGGYTIFAARDSVQVTDIKVIIFLTGLLWVITLSVAAPICRFISKLCANIGHDNIGDSKNAAYIIYTGIIISAGALVSPLLEQYRNYKLAVLLAAKPGAVAFSPYINVGGVLVGLIIIFIGAVLKRVALKTPEIQ